MSNGINSDIFEGDFDIQLSEASPLENEHEVTFGPLDDNDMGIGVDDMLANDEPEFEDSTLDLGIMDIEPPDEDEEVPLINDPTLVIDSFIRHLSANPKLVEALNKGVTAGKLEMIGSSINADLKGLYGSNKLVNALVNAVASGHVVSDRFENAVPNTVKMYYVPSNKKDSIHLHKSSSGVHTYKATPALLAFNEESINKLQAIYASRITGFDTLSNFILESCYRPLAKKTNGDDKAYLAQDNLTIAKSLARSKISIDKGMTRLAGIGMDKSRCDKVAVLAKAIRDNK